MMKPADFGLVLVGVLLNAGAQLLLKAGAGSVGPIQGGFASLRSFGPALATHPGILAGLACYAVSVLVWIVALSRVDVSVAYPMLSIGYVVSALIAWWWFDEAVDLQRWIGIAVIVLGVVLVARSAPAG